jgi:hypothetical protein
MLMKRHLVTAAGLIAIFALCPIASGALILAFDINDRSGDPELSPATNNPVNTAPGFNSYVIANGTNSTVTVGGFSVNFQAVNAAGAPAGAFDDRDRVVPTTTPTLNQLYDDFIFAGGSTGAGGGMNLKIIGTGLPGDPVLLPNKPYRIAIYAFDGIQPGGGSAVPNRIANWSDGNNSDALVLTTNFTTNVPPVNDDDYKFTGVALTDANGQLFLKGRRVTAADLSVYVNGVEIITPIPEPATVSLLTLCSLGLIGLRGRRQ